MTQFTCKSNRSITGYHLNTFTIRISRHFSSAREFQMGNFQKYWSQNVGQDFIVLYFFVGRRKRCVREINVSRAWDPVHAGDKALTWETPAKRGRVNRYDLLWVNITWLLLTNNLLWFNITWLLLTTNFLRVNITWLLLTTNLLWFNITWLILTTNLLWVIIT